MLSAVQFLLGFPRIISRRDARIRSFLASRSRNDRGQTRSRVQIQCVWILFVPPSPLSRRVCDLAITWLDHESWNPLSRGGDSSDRVPLFLLLSPPPFAGTLFHDVLREPIDFVSRKLFTLARITRQFPRNVHYFFFQIAENVFGKDFTLKISDRFYLEKINCSFEKNNNSCPDLLIFRKNLIAITQKSY